MVNRSTAGSMLAAPRSRPHRIRRQDRARIGGNERCEVTEHPLSRMSCGWLDASILPALW